MPVMSAAKLSGNGKAAVLPVKIKMEFKVEDPEGSEEEEEESEDEAFNTARTNVRGFNRYPEIKKKRAIMYHFICGHCEASILPSLWTCHQTRFHSGDVSELHCFDCYYRTSDFTDALTHVLLEGHRVSVTKNNRCLYIRSQISSSKETVTESAHCDNKNVCPTKPVKTEPMEDPEGSEEEEGEEEEEESEGEDITFSESDGESNETIKSEQCMPRQTIAELSIGNKCGAENAVMVTQDSVVRHSTPIKGNFPAPSISEFIKDTNEVDQSGVSGAETDNHNTAKNSSPDTEQPQIYNIDMIDALESNIDYDIRVEESLQVRTISEAIKDTNEVAQSKVNGAETDNQASEDNTSITQACQNCRTVLSPTIRGNGSFKILSHVKRCCGIKPYACTVCGYACARRYIVQAHIVYRNCAPNAKVVLVNKQQSEEDIRSGFELCFPDSKFEWRGLAERTINV